MPLTIINGSAYFTLAVPLKDFPQLLRDHLKENPDTPEVESLGAELVRADFPADKIAGFVTGVCKWGGHEGIRGRVLNRNTSVEIGDALRKASASLAKGRLADALTQVNEINSLGDVSFASKHLRFLRPDICPTFDSILRGSLPYPFDAQGYAAFANDCALLARALAENQIANPRQRKSGAWFVADVEGAVYIFARRSA
ncbi:MAG: hypothetical protein WB762_34435 [Candidatus Sulfotelmatobacter sp.]